MNYYNENDPFAAKWLGELIKAKLIPNGEVDERSIADVEPQDLVSFNQHHFFAGIGGWPYALELSGWNAERPVWSGSCPCQPLSCAGKGLGEKDDRHVWPVWYELIRKLRPSTIFGEQVASKDGREWFSGVRNDLEAVGYAVGAADLPAASVGAPHKRNRLFWVAYSETVQSQGCRPRQGKEQFRRGGAWSNGLADPKRNGGRSNEQGRQAQGREADGWPGFWSNSIPIPCADGKWRRVPGRVENTSRTGTGDNDRKVSGQEWQAMDAGEKSIRQGNGAVMPNGVDADGRVPVRVADSGLPERERWEDTQERQQSGRGDARGKPSPCCRNDATEYQLEIEPALFPLADGVQGRVGLLRGAGNAIIGQVAAEFIQAFMEIRR